MKKLLCAAAILLASGPAWGQQQDTRTEAGVRCVYGDCTWMQDTPDPAVTHYPTGNADLDRAMSICDAHQIPPEGRALESFPADWQSCNAVLAKWGESDAARRERERTAQERADHDFVERFVKGDSNPAGLDASVYAAILDAIRKGASQ